MVSYQKRNLLNSKSPNPSGNLLHAFLPHKYVDHTHSNAILTLTNRANGKALCNDIFNDNVKVMPYIMPGFSLALEVNEYLKNYPEINALILMNHGIFTFSNSAQESYRLMIKYVSIAENYLKKQKSSFAVIKERKISSAFTLR